MTQTEYERFKSELAAMTTAELRDLENQLHQQATSELENPSGDPHHDPDPHTFLTAMIKADMCGRALKARDGEHRPALS